MQAEGAVKPESKMIAAEETKEHRNFEDDAKVFASTPLPETKKSLYQEFKLWRRAVFWSVNISLTIVMESYVSHRHE